MNAQTGLVIQGKALGLLSDSGDIGESVPRRKRHKTAAGVEQACGGSGVTSQGPGAEQIVKLGPECSPYLLCAASSGDSDRALRVASHVWKEAEERRLTWPAQGQVIPFAEKLLEFARAARVYDEDGHPAGFRGGRDPAHAYTAKSFTRGMLIVAEATIDPKLCDKEPLEKIQAFAPDENKHIDCVKHLKGLEVRRRFALSPLMLSCYCCITGWMDRARLKQVLQFDDPKLMSGLHQVLEEKRCRSNRADDYYFPPGPKVLGQMLCQEKLTCSHWLLAD